MPLPYPGRYESHGSWMRRCDEWERNRYSNQNQGLSGKPNRQGIRKGILIDYLPNGKKVIVAKKGYGWRASLSVEKFAKENKLEFIRYNGNGCSGMCERLDGIAYYKIT